MPEPFLTVDVNPISDSSIPSNASPGSALALVNRIRKELRWGETADFSDDLSRTVLDRLNDAQTALFDGFDWECDRRNDGTLRTAATISYTDDVSLTSGANPVLPLSFNDPLTAIVQCLGIPRLWSSADANFGNTSFAFNTYTYSGSTILYLDSGPGMTTWPGTTDTTASAKVLTAEYVLPSTVRKITSMRFQERDIYVEPTNRSQLFDRLIQRIHENQNDIPEIAMVGGTHASLSETTTSYASTLAYPNTNTTVLIWPCPTSSYVLNYSYFLQRFDLVNPTDNLPPTDRSLQDLMTQLAVARIQQGLTGEADPAGGLALETRMWARARQLYENQSRDPGRRRVVQSNFGSSAALSFGRLPINFGTLPNG